MLKKQPGTFSALLLIDANSITTSTTASIEESVNDYDNYTVSGTFQTLIAKAQAKSIDLGFFPALKSATITMVEFKSTAYAVTVTQSSTVLEDLTVDGTTNTLSVSGANKLTSLTTAGEIIRLLLWLTLQLLLQLLWSHFYLRR